MKTSSVIILILAVLGIVGGLASYASLQLQCFAIVSGWQAGLIIKYEVIPYIYKRS